MLSTATATAGGAQYKLRSPDKLPISRSTCISISHDLFITNVKPEPSPTTGSFLKSQIMQGSTCSAALSLNARCSVSKALDDSNSSLFELRQHIRSSDDGFNWRKYGQKVVKGSEFPRSYYKCTHPKCDVKKIFERSYTGQIVEIVYKGTHDHPKPQSSRRFTAGALVSIQEENDSKVLYGPDKAGLSTSGGQVPVPSPKQANDGNMDGTVPQLNITNDGVEDGLNSKRRRTDFGTLDITPVVKPIREPRVVVQTVSEVDILDDGYRWRKYGRKVVRGNPNPRSYYKCSSAGCPVRKHVERASHDPKAVINTYEGKHSHDLPTAKSNSHNVAGPTVRRVIPMIRSDANDAIFLDLLVGNRFSEQQPQALNVETIHSQVHVSNSNFNELFPSKCYDMSISTKSWKSTIGPIKSEEYQIK